MRVLLIGSEQPATIAAVLGMPVEHDGKDVTVDVVPGQRLDVMLRDARAACWQVSVAVPDPVPPETVLRVPAKDDPRLVSPVFRVVDAASGRPLPDAYLDAGRAGPTRAPLRADADGRIVVPSDLVEALDAQAPWRILGGFGAPGYEPAYWPTVTRWNGDAADWTAWDRDGALPIRLKALPAGVRYGNVRVVDAADRPLVNVLLVLRYDVLELGLSPAFSARTNAKGEASVPVTSLFAADAWRDGVVVGTYALGEAGFSPGAPAVLRAPDVVSVRLEIEGVEPERMPEHVWVRPAAVDLLVPANGTGLAVIDRKERPGWEAIEPAEGVTVDARAGEAGVFDLRLPLGRETQVRLSLRDAPDEARVVRLHPTEPGTVRVAWADLGRPPPDRHVTEFRSGEDARPAAEGR